MDFIEMQCWIILIVLPSCMSQFIGVGEVNIERLETCSEQKNGIKLEIKMYKHNRTHRALSGYLETKYPIDEEVSCNLTAAKWGDGGWKPNYVDVYDSYCCRWIKSYVQEQLYEMLRLMDHPKQCPIMAGSYNVSNFFFATDSYNSLLFGKFRADVIFAKNGQVAACIRAYATIEPKKKFG